MRRREESAGDNEVNKQARRVGENWLLAALPDEEYRGLLPHLEPVHLGLKEVIYNPNEPIPYVYFPRTGLISLLTVMDDGSAVEVGTVGNEGMVGIPIVLGADSTPGLAFSQIPGEYLRMRSQVLREYIGTGRRAGSANGNGDRMLSIVLQRYTQALFNQIAQTAACNRLHPVDERCARWLLMTHDRIGSDEFPLTQEFLSQMLGVRRATVSTAAGVLQRAGLIRYSRGRITILDRPGLEAASCECYGIIRDEFERLLKNL